MGPGLYTILFNACCVVFIYVHIWQSYVAALKRVRLLASCKWANCQLVRLKIASCILLAITFKFHK